MIVVNLEGRLGNQLFQYAFAFNAAKKKKTRFFFYPREKNVITKYFYLDAATHFLFLKGIFTVYNRLLKYMVKQFYSFEKIAYNVWMHDIEIKNNVHYSGHYQSEQYFLDSKKEIISKFEIKKSYQRYFLKKYGSLFAKNKVIVLHIRRTDYLLSTPDGGDLGGNLCLPMSYYDNCLARIKDLDTFRILCVSDDIDFVREYYKDRHFSFEKNEEIIDFQLIQHADIVIMANSTFSWWAAYLNKKPDKIIFAPKYWLGFRINKECPVNIVPDNFIQVDVM